MEAGRSPSLTWSDNTYCIKDVALKKEFNLPLLVKVEEGIYGNKESESFSQNDLIKIDSVKVILKVVACCVDYQSRANNELRAIREDEHGYIEKTEELTIPLRYKGVVNIFHKEGEKIYCGVSEMLRDCPRYVKVLVSFTDKNKVSVPVGSVLELTGIVSCKDLVCYLVDRPNCSRRTEIILKYSNKWRFRRIPDNTDYTLQEVTSRFPLPQYVTFKKESGPKLVTTNIKEAVEHSRIFEGTVAIKRRIEQDYIIGHYKPPESVANNTKYQCQRTLVMIPLNSPTARDLNVRISLNTQDDDDYELLMARNFSQKDVSEGDIDGTVYMDFLKTPKSTFIVYDEIETPPPRPLRGKVVKNSPITPPLSSPPGPTSPPPLPPKKEMSGMRRERQDDRGYSNSGRNGIDKNLADAVTNSKKTPPTSYSSSPQCSPRKSMARMRPKSPDG
ncbi:uncharacterized protein LOC110442008 [Mizuhopecten yessoensis]|uniref:CABIT domain-containing protein n=1 Tax=Mizuhopecten yessoensis TaxID=6573 RepID=A0A210PI63_MIZYE|nr:uncharacterized protein LOC110442008 [Mizuhopecten yessoensis]OWF36179.1 hypothetical protein KP79_PYT09034 [Mizuhopecten yessoensis]